MIRNAISKILKYGAINSSQVLLQRLKKERFRKKTYKQDNPYTWKTIAQKHRLPSFALFYEQLKNNKFILGFENTHFKKYLSSPNKDLLLQKANAILDNRFEILGHNQQFNKYKILWHQDFKSNYIKPKNLFYQDIKIKSNTKTQLDNHLYDVKIPWELSRFQYLLYLGKAYEETKNEDFPNKFVDLVEDWIDKNPFLIGVNWMCPMEVAIRAINLIWAFHYFKDTQSIPLEFWEKFTCSLYQHANYLENNWEIFFKNNNHYIADLLGYFFLCSFFKNIKYFKVKQDWCYKKLLKEFYKQILPDGTSYEGSTNYHKLVTEMYLHFHILCDENDLHLPKSFEVRFNKMLNFLDDCSDHNNNIVQIGDNDSGKILTGINTQNTNNLGVYHYPHFGISVIKTSEWHISFRHPTFNNKQPNGHFHSDELSVTLSINGIPILVDPGTYVYTGNPLWRNLMRSKENHNGPYLRTKTAAPPIFELPRGKQADTSLINENTSSVFIENVHKKSPNLTVNRRLTFNKNKQYLKLEDWWDGNFGDTSSLWTFIFNPRITLYKRESENLVYWEITYNSKVIAYFMGPSSLKEKIGHYSESYGKIEKTTKLTMNSKINIQNKHSFIFSSSLEELKKTY